MITSKENRQIKLIRALQSKRQTRRQERAFVIEGKRMAQEALSTGIAPIMVLYTEAIAGQERSLLNQLARLGTEIELVSENVMRSCSDTKNPAGILAVVSFSALPAPDPLSFALVIDHLADPGNLGTLLRTALAAGVQAVFLTEGTVDPYNPKVVRGAMGAHLRLPIIEAPLDELKRRLAGLELWISDSGPGQIYYDINWRRPAALVIGNEAHGVSRAIHDIANGVVYIPMPGPVESLNAAIAGAVILYEIVRQRGME